MNFTPVPSPGATGQAGQAWCKGQRAWRIEHRVKNIEQRAKGKGMAHDVKGISESRGRNPELGRVQRAERMEHRA